MNLYVISDLDQYIEFKNEAMWTRPGVVSFQCSQALFIICLLTNDYAVQKSEPF